MKTLFVFKDKWPLRENSFVLFHILKINEFVIKLFCVVRITMLFNHLPIDTNIILFVQIFDNWMILHGLSNWFLLVDISIYIFIEYKRPHCIKTLFFVSLKRNDFFIRTLPIISLCFNLHLDQTWPHHILHLFYNGNRRQFIKPLLLFWYEQRNNIFGEIFIFICVWCSILCS